MSIYPENPTFKALTESAYSLGRSLGKTRPRIAASQARESVGNITSALQTPTNLANLGVETTPYGGSTKFEQYHLGVDLAGKYNTPVPAINPGIVTDIKTGQVQGDPGFGNFVVITDPQTGRQFRYSHLSNDFVPLKIGQQVNKGTILGGEGNSGQTYSEHGGSGTHLDLRIKNAYGKYENPTPYLSSYFSS